MGAGWLVFWGVLGVLGRSAAGCGGGPWWGAGVVRAGFVVGCGVVGGGVRGWSGVGKEGVGKWL